MMRLGEPDVHRNPHLGRYSDRPAMVPPQPALDERRPRVLSILDKTHHRRTRSGGYQEYAVQFSAHDVAVAPSTVCIVATQLHDRL
ncbi:MAG: hypothetical protein DI630_03955 [Gordonia sp. (in: high G+C Gram-positive bacteria)]|nr:MAG: hypothetical protein DI630_03955 [Gordonia sp. (in: high G+C Gram-positive bacteria)]